MHECASVLRINLWRKRGIVSKLAQGLWFEYETALNETVLFPNQVPYSRYGNWSNASDLENIFRGAGILLNAIIRKEYSNAARNARANSHFNFSGVLPNMSDVQVCK